MAAAVNDNLTGSRAAKSILVRGFRHVGKSLRDACYAGAGLGVLGFVPTLIGWELVAMQMRTAFPEVEDGSLVLIYLGMNYAALLHIIIWIAIMSLMIRTSILYGRRLLASFRATKEGRGDHVDA